MYQTLDVCFHLFAPSLYKKREKMLVEKFGIAGVGAGLDNEKKRENILSSKRLLSHKNVGFVWQHE
jgi:hypothetical protein